MGAQTPQRNRSRWIGITIGTIGLIASILGIVVFFALDVPDFISRIRGDQDDTVSGAVRQTVNAISITQTISAIEETQTQNAAITDEPAVSSTRTPIDTQASSPTSMPSKTAPPASTPVPPSETPIPPSATPQPIVPTSAPVSQDTAAGTILPMNGTWISDGVYVRMWADFSSPLLNQVELHYSISNQSQRILMFHLNENINITMQDDQGKIYSWSWDYKGDYVLEAGESYSDWALKEGPFTGSYYIITMDIPGVIYGQWRIN